MYCIDPPQAPAPCPSAATASGRRWGSRLALALGLGLGAGLLNGCNHASPTLPARPSAAVSAAPSATPSASATPAANDLGHGAARPGTAAPRRPPRPARPARHWDDYRQQAAERIVEANPAGSYLGPVPEPLLAIPVLEVELHADGSVRRIQVMRKPGQALDTVQLAIDAVQRAAPFGPVAHLPRPWKFTEVFLFDDQRRFKPRSLDL